MFKYRKYPAYLAILATMLCALPGAAFAYGETPQSQIAGIYLESDPTNNFMAIKGTWSNPDSCKDPSAIDIILETSSSPNYKDMEAAVYAAYTTGQTVGFWVSGCDGYGHPTAYAVVLPSQ